MRKGLRKAAWLLALALALGGMTLARAEEAAEPDGIDGAEPSQALEIALEPGEATPDEAPDLWSEAPVSEEEADASGPVPDGAFSNGPEAVSEADEAGEAVRLKLNVEQRTLGVGETYALRATLLDAEGREVEGALKYRSSNRTYARVSAEGVIKGRKKGTAKITVTGPNGLKAVCKVTVRKAPRSIAVLAKKPRLAYAGESEAGESTTLKVTLTSGSASAITYSGYDPAVVRVSRKGKVKAVGYGTTTITAATFNGKTAECTVRVMAPEQMRPENVAHRGGAGYWPENTLKAFRKAASTGANAVELDVRTTRDGVQVVHHDAYIRSGGKKVYLADKKYSKLKKLDPGLCTLDEALEVISERKLNLYLELKDTADAKACVKAVKRWGMRERTMFISLRAPLLRQVRKADKKARLGYVFKETPSDIQSLNAELKLTAVAQKMIFLTQANVVKWQNMGLLVNTWTVDDKSEIKKAASWGVDSIMGNYPKRIAAILK